MLNHTSDQHPWFQRARQAAPGSRWRDFYVWSDTADKYQDARIIFKDFETSNWTWDPVAKAYYWHRFYSHQPDLNFDSPLRPAGCAGRDRFLVRHRSGWVPAGRRPLSVRARGNQLREPPRDPRLLEAAARAHRFQVQRSHLAGRSEPVAGGRGRLFRRRRRMPHGVSLSADAPAVHGHPHGGSFPDHRNPAGNSPHSGRRRSGRCSCATTTN